MNGASSNQLLWSTDGYSYTIYTLMDMNGWSSNSPHCSWVPYFVRPILHLWGCYNKSHYKIGTSWIDPNTFGSSVNECPRVRLQHPQLIPGVWFLNDTYTYGTVDTYGFVGPADFVPWKHSCKLGQNPCNPMRLDGPRQRSGSSARGSSSQGQRDSWPSGKKNICWSQFQHGLEDDFPELNIDNFWSPMLVFRIFQTVSWHLADKGFR